MIYLGRFTFEANVYGQHQEGEFTLIIEADDIEAATQKMASLVSEKYRHLLEDAKSVFLTDVFEIEKIPAEGIVPMVSYQPSEPPVLSLRVVLPDNDDRDCRNYRQGPDPEEDLEAANAYEQEPFLIFDDGGSADAGSGAVKLHDPPKKSAAKKRRKK